MLDAARVGTAAIAEELGGLSVGKLHAADLAADALHQALGAAVAHEAAAPPSAGRTLVAMSRRGRQHGRRRAAARDPRRGRRRHARALARPRERRRGLVLLGQRRALGARDRPPHGPAALHARPARGLPRRRRRAVAGRARRGPDAQPVRALQRRRPPRRDGRLRRPRSAPRRWPPATTRAARPTACCAPPPTTPRTRPTCWPR